MADEADVQLASESIPGPIRLLQVNTVLTELELDATRAREQALQDAEQQLAATDAQLSVVLDDLLTALLAKGVLTNAVFSVRAKALLAERAQLRETIASLQ